MEKTALSQEKRPLNETNIANTLILHFQPPNLWGNEVMLFKLPCLQHLVKSALANKYDSDNKKHLQTPNANDNKGGFSPRTFRGSVVLHLGLLASKSVGEEMFLLF